MRGSSEARAEMGTNGNLKGSKKNEGQEERDGAEGTEREPSVLEPRWRLDLSQRRPGRGRAHGAAGTARPTQTGNKSSE